MNKFHAVRTEYKGIAYASKKEAAFAATLDILRRANNPKERVIDWRGQVPFAFNINEKLIFVYKADFFVNYADGHTEVIDVKGGEATKTPLYRLKKKIIENVYNIIIKEI